MFFEKIPEQLRFYFSKEKEEKKVAFLEKIYTILQMTKTWIILSLAVLGTGCFGPANNTQRGAGQGAIIGGILGGVIGHNNGGKTAEGAAIGALGGALLGGAVGNEEDKKQGKK